MTVRTFAAQYPTPHNCCVRFVAAVAGGPRNTRYRAGATPYPGRTFTGWIRSAYPDAPPQLCMVPIAFGTGDGLGLRDCRTFAAHYPASHNCCVRFVADVTGGHATLATGRALPITRTGLSPAGPDQLILTHPRCLDGPDPISVNIMPTVLPDCHGANKMRKIQLFELEGGGTVAVEVDAVRSEEERIATARDQVVEDAKQKFGHALEGVQQAAAEVLKGFSEALQPAELELTFGLKFSAKAGVVLASTDAEATLNLRAKWRKQPG